MSTRRSFVPIRHPRSRSGQILLPLTLVCVSSCFQSLHAQRQPHDFTKDIQPILIEYCYDCHGDGMDKGNVAFDAYTAESELLANKELWLKVVKNLRAGLMPPASKPRPSADQLKRLETWVKYDTFRLDPADPDPGKVTLRRLNRVEYRNTVRDLMGADFNSEVEFPPDDTGYGFDNIGDVLTISPMLLEKYLAAAQTIVSDTVPTVARVMPERILSGREFKTADNHDDSRESQDGPARRGRRLDLSVYEPALVKASHSVQHSGDYQLRLELVVDGEFDFDPGKCRAVFRVDGQTRMDQEFGWQDGKRFTFDFDETWQGGQHRFELELVPLTSSDKKVNSLELCLDSLSIRGPLDVSHWDRPKNYDRFFPSDPPKDAAERRQYARDILRPFASKAFRRPIDEATLDRLVSLAETAWNQPGKTVEAGVAHAMVAVLASPRFLFRLEGTHRPASPTGGFPELDEYALASRLSYFLWSTMPDAELFRLAEQGKLRAQLTTQVQRMLADSRSDALIENFTGQWLQTRDVEGAPIDSRVVLARDAGQEREMRREMEERRARRAAAEAPTPPAEAGAANRATNNAATNAPPFRRPRFNRPRIELDQDVRLAMREETELCVAEVVRKDRSVTELIQSDYTFLNEKLARFYGLTNLAISGSDMRMVQLPADHPRGGVLTQGSVLVVTSNPDRTSPVKRGLFILDNILGTPPPPPPQDVPALEEAEKEFSDHEPTLREALALHREKPLCASCHNRMDPLGLALENFNAMGLWRDQERGQPIDAAGRLITGETFESVQELKRVLVDQHRSAFYRCLTEKLLTYALGRGPEFYDLETIDQIVARMEAANGRFSALLMGIIESAPFQKMRPSERHQGPDSENELTAVFP